jgi:hypothetical protein
MSPLDTVSLLNFARKYVWWKKPEEAVKHPDRVVAQVMNIGDYDDIQLLVRNADPQYLRDVLSHAEAGQFDPKSWAYWHYRLDLSSEPDDLPPMPQR